MLAKKVRSKVAIGLLLFGFLPLSGAILVGCFDLGGTGHQADTEPPPTQPLDRDSDGIPDTADVCLGTPEGFEVDESGCAASQRDADGDGVPDDDDECATTLLGTQVDGAGCPVDQPPPGPQVFTVSIALLGEGTVASPGGEFEPGATIILTPRPAEGWRFDRWGGDVANTDNPLRLIVSRNLSISAVFVQQFTLTVNVRGQGSVVLDPPGGGYDADTRVMVTANAAPGWLFDHWEGAVIGISANTEFSLGEDQTVTAVFVEEIVLFALRVEVNGQGSVDLSPRGIPDGGAWLYVAGREVRLTATPDEGFVFEGWEGDTSSTSRSILLTLNSNALAIASFGVPPFIAGDIFSFLTVQETELFRVLADQANDEITRWEQDELRAISAEMARRGLSRSSIAYQLACDARQQAVEMRRAATWLVLDDPLGLSFLTLFFLDVTEEVDQWNCQRYPDPSCAVLRMCR